MRHLPIKEHIEITTKECLSHFIFPNGFKNLPKGFMEEFSEEDDDPLYFVKDFKIKSNFIVKIDEYTYMKEFVWYLDEEALDWFKDLGKGIIYSLAELIEEFCSCWCLGKRKKWMPYVKEARNLFKKEEHTRLDEEVP